MRLLFQLEPARRRHNIRGGTRQPCRAGYDRLSAKGSVTRDLFASNSLEMRNNIRVTRC